MTMIRGYALETCWLIALLVITAAPHRVAVAQEFAFDDQSDLCPLCVEAPCVCLNDEGGW